MPTRLAAARTARGWTQGQLMRAMRARARIDGHELPDSGTLRVMLSRWENGRHHPAPFYRRLIAEALDMTEADLGFPLPSWLGLRLPGLGTALPKGPPYPGGPFFVPATCPSAPPPLTPKHHQGPHTVSRLR